MMEIPKLCFFNLVFLWIILSIDCISVDTSGNDGIDYDTDASLASEALRYRRKSDFDRGYDEFLRNYHSDNDIEKHGHYKVQNSDDGSDDGSEEGGSEESVEESAEEQSEESEESERYREPREPRQPQKQAKPKKKNGGPRPVKKPVHKGCKTEKRKNMICKICYDPKDDEKTESCSYNSEPKEHNYAYSEDSTFGNGKGNKDKELESLESSGSSESEFDRSEDRENAPKKKPPPHRYPVYRGRKSPRFYPTYSFRPSPLLNYGPQTFYPYQPTPGSRGKPIRLQQSPSPDVTVVRYRSIEPVLPSHQRIRVITYPDVSPNQFSNSQKNAPQKNPPSERTSDVRPPRDIHTAQIENLWTNVTKEHHFEYLPSRLVNGASRTSFAFINKDGSKCRKSSENNKVCFECVVEGERRKECAYKSKPKHYFESFSKSKKSSTKQKPERQRSKIQHQSKQERPKHQYKSKPIRVYDEKPAEVSTDDFINQSTTEQAKTPIKYIDENISTTEKQPENIQENTPIPNNKPDERVPDVIYGKIQLGSEPLYVQTIQYKK